MSKFFSVDLKSWHFFVSLNPILDKKYTYHEAKLKIEHWCAYQERCQYEVSTKLQTWNLPFDEIQSLLAELISTNFINEERFADSFVSGKFNIKRWGKIKIKQHLKAKFISNYSIEKGLKQISREDYQATIQKLIVKKSADFKTTDSEYQRKAKVHNYLASKGYEFNEIENGWEDFLVREKC